MFKNQEMKCYQQALNTVGKMMFAHSEKADSVMKPILEIIGMMCSASVEMIQKVMLYNEATMCASEILPKSFHHVPALDETPSPEDTDLNGEDLTQDEIDTVNELTPMETVPKSVYDKINFLAAELNWTPEKLRKMMQLAGNDENRLYSIMLQVYQR